MLWSDASDKPNQKYSWAKPIPFLLSFWFFFSLNYQNFIDLKYLSTLSCRGIYFYSSILNLDIFVLPETSGSRLCWGATCQEYFRYRGIKSSLKKCFWVHPANSYRIISTQVLADSVSKYPSIEISTRFSNNHFATLRKYVYFAVIKIPLYRFMALPIRSNYCRNIST